MPVVSFDRWRCNVSPMGVGLGAGKPGEPGCRVCEFRGGQSYCRAMGVVGLFGTGCWVQGAGIGVKSG